MRTYEHGLDDVIRIGCEIADNVKQGGFDQLTQFQLELLRRFAIAIESFCSDPYNDLIGGG
jgi:hypothetical protein